MLNNLLLLFCLFTFSASALLGQQKKVTLSAPIGTYIGGYLEHLPADYAANPTKKYPLLLFMHGMGEIGDGSSLALDKVLRNGPPMLIEKGAFPPSFTVGGQSFSFIVISPQFNNDWIPASTVDAFLNYIIAKYRVDTTRLYLTGLSMGGGFVWAYSSASQANARRVAAIVPVCGANTPTVAKANNMAAENLPIWALHNDGDPRVSSFNSKNYVKYFNEYIPTPSPLAKLTIWPSTSHNAWTKAYDPAYKEDAMNVYEWMLQYTRGGTEPPPPPPPVNKLPIPLAGTDKNLMLPVTGFSLDGRGSYDPDGSISGYLWSQIQGGPVSLSSQFSALTNAGAVTLPGTYKFVLQVTDNKGAKATDTISIVVSAAANLSPVANAGADLIITLPTTTASLDGGASSDPDGTIQAYSWLQLSGPAVAISSAATAKTLVSGFAAAGTYSFQLTVTDDKGLKDTDTVLVKVSAAANLSPVANAGADLIITLPTTTASLDGGASSDPDGTIQAYSWLQLSGSAIAIGGAATAKTLVSGFAAAGTYSFQLTVTDDKGLKDTDTVLVKVSAAANLSPVANAGTNQVLTLPTDSTVLSGAGSSDPDGAIQAYSWVQLSGPAAAMSAGNLPEIEVRMLGEGLSVFELSVTDNMGAVSKASVTITVNKPATPPPPPPVTPPPATPSAKNANNGLPVYNGQFEYGANPGYYANGWDDIGVAKIAHDAGVNTLRLALPSSFIEKYGVNIRKKEFDFYTNTLGMKDLTLFIEKPNAGQKDTTNYGSCGPSNVFANLYDSIWDSGANGTPINDVNYFAAYVYKLVMNYGSKVKFWEIWNEPDFSFSSAAWKGPGLAGNWWENDPSPCQLENLHAPVYTYIRMMRIAYEVIKKFDQDALICTGGIGYESFLDVILRNTDNPDGGKVSAQYPDKGGAYFDVLSFHSYPIYRLSTWSNAIGGFVEKRNSDEAAYQFILHKKNFESVLHKYGYGYSYPGKYFICTETNIPRKSFNSYLGSDEAQYNYTIKSLIGAQANGVRQLYFYQTGETEDYATATKPYSLMGLYENLKRDVTGKEKITHEGVALKTTALMLRGYTYDSVETKLLNAPSSVQAYAFKNSAGEKRFVLWAALKRDLVESAIGSFSFPAALDVKSAVSYSWNYSVDPNAKSVSNGSVLDLTGTPVFVDISSVVIPVENKAPLAYAGKDRVIQLPTDSILLDGSASADPDGTIVSYLWKKVSGLDSLIINNSNESSTLARKLKVGIYSFELLVIDNNGLEGRDTILVEVKASATPGTSNKLPVIVLNDDIFYVSTDSVRIDARGSFDPDGDVLMYKWELIKGAVGQVEHGGLSAVFQVSNLEPGDYIYRVTVTDGKGGSAAREIHLYVKTSKVALVRTYIYPNPIKGETATLVVADTKAGNALLKLYAANGAVIWIENFEKPAGSFSRRVQLDMVPAGQYFLELAIDNQRIATIKVIK